ncbi:MAG: DKNYY domain-containing protein [Bacteroidetes bacterium]|nr:DKNYY domain-containing protein [Bacteroidota bacterium]
MNPLRATGLLKFLPQFAVSFLFLSGCSTGYRKEGSVIYYEYWNEGSGSHKDRLDADPETFEVLKDDNYAKDKQKVFYNGGVIIGADAATFESLDERYARDKNRGYYGRDRILSSRGQTFRVIDDDYSSDGVNVFYDTLPLNVCSVKDFRFVMDDKDKNERWATDGCFYYYGKYKVPSDDYANMQVFKNSGGLSKDKNYVYFLDHKLNFDVDRKKVVDTIDAESFKVTGFLECRDKWGCFNPYHGRQNCNEK